MFHQLLLIIKAFYCYITEINNNIYNKNYHINTMFILLLTCKVASTNGTF